MLHMERPSRNTLIIIIIIIIIIIKLTPSTGRISQSIPVPTTLRGLVVGHKTQEQEITTIIIIVITLKGAIRDL